MSAKEAPIAYRTKSSSPTLVGTIDYWRLRREYIEDAAVHVSDLDPWMQRLYGARKWEALKRPW